VDPVRDRWQPISLINKVELSDAEDQGVLACAVWGTPPMLSFNFIPAIDLPVFPLRAWYETAPSNQLPADTPRLNPNYLPLLKYQTAIICREVFLGLPTKQSLIEMRNEMQLQYVRYANKAPSQKAEAKLASYGTELLDQYYRPWDF
jgi:hypothetical protein